MQWGHQHQHSHRGQWLIAANLVKPDRQTSCTSSSTVDVFPLLWLCVDFKIYTQLYPVNVAPSQTHGSTSIMVFRPYAVGGFSHMWHTQRNHIRDYVAWRRSSDSISLIESVLRLSSTGCLGDSLLEAGRGAASSTAYMKPLEVNFLIKSPQPSTLPPPAFVLNGCMRFNFCVCSIHGESVFMKV